MLLLLMTDLRDRELVFGKLCASLLLPAVLLASSIPVLAIVHMLGGVSLEQIGCAIAISAAAGLVAGTWGSLVAFWREKTFQTLAISLIGIVIYLGVVETVAILAGANSTASFVVGTLNPFRALLRVLEPCNTSGGTTVVTAALVSTGALTGRRRDRDHARDLFERDASQHMYDRKHRDRRREQHGGQQ